MRFPLPRRALPSWLGIAVGLAGLLPAVLLAADGPTYRLKAAGVEGGLRRVRAQLEVEGQLKLNPDGKRVTRTPMKVQAEVLYDERPLGQRGAGRVRQYLTAEAQLTVAGQTTAQGLRPERRTIVAAPDGEAVVLFSPLGPLTRDELELIEIPGARLDLAELLPDGETAVGGAWSVRQEAVAQLLGLDLVHEADVRGRLRAVEGGKALVEFSGKGAGSAGGVAADFELAAKCNVDVGSGRISWLAMAARENRAVGHAEPGYEAMLRLRMAAMPIAASPALADDALAELPLTLSASAALLEYRSPHGGYHILYPRSWRIMIDRHDVTVLRLIDQGDLIAQCNISALEDLPAGRRLTLAAFREEIQRALGESFRQFLDAAEQQTEQGLHMLRVTAAGEAEQLPIQWTYYHLSNDEGRRVSLVFTMESKLVERFGGADEALVSSLELVPAEPAASAESAEQARRADESGRR